MTPVEQITSLYIGYFGRAPDPEGLNYWVGRLADGYTLAEAAESFSVQPESTAKYPYLANPNIASPQAFITQVYMNLFNRVPDAEGLAYWTAELQNGADIGDFILNVISGAVTAPDSTIIANKVEVGVDFALAAADVPGFVYDADAADAAVEVIDGVDATDASVEAAKAETDAFISGGVTGQTFTLTTALGEEVVGTAGNDTFNVITDGAATLNTFDTISGGAGRDTALLVSTAAAVLPTASQMTGVENVVLDAGALTLALDASVLADVESVEFINNGVTALTLGAGQSVTLSNTTAAATTVTVDAEETDTTITVDGVATGQSVTLVGDANTTLNVEGSVAGAGDLTVEAADTTETINLNLTSDGIITLAPAAADAVTVVDASASSGALEIDASVLGGVEALRGGSGDDTLTGGAASLLIDGGAGDDDITAGNFAGEVIIGGAGVDGITLGAAGDAQTVVFNAGDTGITAATLDTVANFTTTEDLLDFNLEAGSATNFLADASAGGFLDALVNANTAFASDSALTYVASTFGGNTTIFVDSDNDGSADAAVQLTGVGAGGVAFGDIIA